MDREKTAAASTMPAVVFEPPAVVFEYRPSAFEEPVRISV
jgi:hypothetical protein